MLDAAHILVVLVTLATVAAAVLVHYEGLAWISRRIAGREGRHRRRVLYAICGVLTLHVAEIWLFGLAFAALLAWPACGAITGLGEVGVLDAVYFSSITYSTVGFGDLVPTSAVRFLAGTEALVGLVLIGWSASFTYLEMERYWRR